jgi:hypothetical protein
MVLAIAGHRFQFLRRRFFSATGSLSFHTADPRRNRPTLEGGGAFQRPLALFQRGGGVWGVCEHTP